VRGFVRSVQPFSDSLAGEQLSASSGGKLMGGQVDQAAAEIPHRTSSSRLHPWVAIVQSPTLSMSLRWGKKKAK
jgi:hypothetical protein